jgi:CheY-like chemotaxis protein
VASLLGPQARGKGIELSVAVDGSVPRNVRGDPGRLGQILINLVGNAIKFTEAGSVAIEVRLEVDTGDRVRLRIAVTDTGIGIAEEHQARLFTRFSQVDSSTTRRFGGTGLGLAICKQLCALMDGEIGVQSAPGAGSTFWFVVEVGKVAGGAAAAADSAALAASAQQIGRSLRVLVVEDNPANQKVAAALLTKSGHRADVAANGIEAVNAVRAVPYDLVLMDVHMPEMDGITATKAIRVLTGARGRVPIIAVTADAMTGDRDRCLAAGMDDYVSKPIEPAALLAAIARWCGGERRDEGSPRSDGGEEKATAKPRRQPATKAIGD